MKTILKISSIFIIFSLVIIGCQPSLSPTVNKPIEKPATALPVEQEKKPNDPIATAMINPTAKAPEVPVVEENKVELATVEYASGFYISYDPAIWQKEGEKPYYDLKLKNEETCILHYQFGHGMDFEQFDVVSFDQKIGSTTFTISRYWRRSTGENILYSYVWDNWNHYFSAENSTALKLSDNCLEQVDEVIRISEAKGFKP